MEWPKISNKNRKKPEPGEPTKRKPPLNKKKGLTTLELSLEHPTTKITTITHIETPTDKINPIKLNKDY